MCQVTNPNICIIFFSKKNENENVSVSISNKTNNNSIKTMRCIKMKTQLFMNAFLAYLRYPKGRSNRSTVKQPVIPYKTIIPFE